jgi:glycosyltransferase involved in cell wall biosynthesis
LHLGGAERQLLELARRLDRDRFDPAICTFTTGGELVEEAQDSGIRVHVLRRRGHREWRRVWQLRKLMKSGEIAIAHSLTFEANMYNILANIPRCARAVICSERTVGNWDRHGYEAYERVFLRFADHVTTNSHSARDFLLRRRKISKCKMSVIYNGVAVEDYQTECPKPLRAKLRKELGVDENARIVGMVANLRQKVKNHRLLLTAAAQVVSEISDATFVFVGEGAQEKQALQELADRSGLAAHVIFTGARQDIARLLSLFEVGILCSDHEGFPNAVLEYMAAALPVVATNAGGCSELVDDGNTGFLIPPGHAAKLAEKIIWLLRNPGTARQMGRCGHERVQNSFSIERMVKSTVDLYQRVLCLPH